MKFTLELQVRRTVRRFQMLAPGEQVLVAVSGGADSTALLVCLKHVAEGLKLKLTAAHLNHLLRGAESEADEEFVRATCNILEIPLVSERRDVGSLARGRNLEETARRVRYEFLREGAARVGADKIAVAHNQQDQAETVLLHLLRGSGVEGLAGIHPVAGRVIRPLIESTREQILAYLRERGFGWREDASNAQVTFRRNRVRRELLPYLRTHFNSNATEVLAREAELFRRVADYLDIESGREYRRIRTRKGRTVSLPVAELSALHPALRTRAIRHALRERRGDLRRITSAQIEEVAGLCGSGKGGRRVELPGGVAAAREFDCLVITHAEAGPPAFSHALSVPGRCRVDEIGLEVKATVREDASGADPNAAILDPEAVGGSLVVRSRMPGDRYGAAGRRKVKKMLIDARIGRRTRERLPMIACRDAVIWIPGFKPARAFAAKPGKPVLVLEIAPYA